MLTYPPRLLIGKSLYVKFGASVPLFDFSFSKVKGVAPGGKYIGKISDFEVKDGIIYWKFNNASAEFFRYVPFFVMNDPSKIRFDKNELNYISKEDIVKEKARVESSKRELLKNADYKEKGFFRYYFEKYMPYIIIGGIVVFLVRKK